MGKMDRKIIEAMQRDRSAGMTGKVIAEKYHLSETVVYKHTTAPRRITKEAARREEHIKVLDTEEIGKIGALYRAGWTLENIAGDIGGGCTEKEVVKVIRRNRGKEVWS